MFRLELGLLCFAFCELSCGHVDLVMIDAGVDTGGFAPFGGAPASGGVTSGDTAASSTGGAPASSAGGTSSGAGGTSASSTGGAPASSAGGTSSGAGGTSASSTGENLDPGCVIRVAKTGSNSNNGSTWALALNSVQLGLDAASTKLNEAVCSTVEVWVAAGTYTPNHLADSTDARSATFRLVTNVALYGGFSGTELSRATRDINANVTILSGDLGTIGDLSDNSRHVVMGATGATLDGFTITKGYADGSGTNPRGGGMYNISSSPTVSDCAFTGNSATFGGGMFNESSSPVVSNCSFTKNIGGGMNNNNDSSPVVSNCSFASNEADSGAGMSNSNSSPMVTYCSFTANGPRGYGSGMFNYNSSPTVSNCSFTDNESYYGGGMYNTSSSSPTVANCTFAGNWGSTGGGMSNVDHSSPIVYNCSFTGNEANSGSGIYNNNSSATVYNCTFTDNVAFNDGAAVFNDFVAYPQGPSTATLTNCILWDNTEWGGTTINEIGNGDASCSATVSYSIVQGGYASGTNIFDSDPLFVDAGNGNLHLTAGSPAIDAGSSCIRARPSAGWLTGALTDLEGNSRWDITNVPNALHGFDLGAFEYQGSADTDTLISSFSCP